ncbi:MAG: ABC transporter ATP-binding protein [Phycisphaerae bacterium]|nr:ABC transporter ATP-binding protein [Phycisphaerae bacterium]
MADNYILLEDVGLRFRLYATPHRSIKETVVNFLTRRRYGAPTREVEALRDVRLRIGHGQRLGIVGDNGAGKSSLLKVVSRIYPPTSGRVHTQGFLVPLLEVGIGFNHELSGRENIYLTGAIMGFGKKQMAGRVDPILDFAELREFADTPVKYYSSGMAQRLAFSIATEIDPEILLLDEATSSVDSESESRIQRGVLELMKGRTSIVVAHRLSTILHADEILVMHHGRVVERGRHDALLRQGGVYQRLYRLQVGGASNSC